MNKDHRKFEKNVKHKNEIGVMQDELIRSFTTAMLRNWLVIETFMTEF